jgi:hypothetical protein
MGPQQTHWKQQPSLEEGLGYLYLSKEKLAVGSRAAPVRPVPHTGLTGV